MSFSPRFNSDATEELKAIRKFDQKKIVSAIEAKLADDPTKETKNRKRLDPLSPGFEHDGPLWELRVGDFRVFYDVNEDEKVVTIRAIRQKKPKDRTEDVVQ